MRSTLIALLVCLASLAGARAQSQSQTDAGAYVRTMRSSKALRNAVWGVKAMDGKGRIIVDYNGGQMMTPASNMKLVTTGTALHALGADYKFTTTIAYSGTVVEGTLHGDVYIVGGGDPTIGVKDSIALKPEALFWKWKTLLKSAGISSIDGRIIGDGRSFEGHLENTSWEYDDLGTDYGTGGNGLCFYANAQDYEVSAGPSEGAAVNVRIKYPLTPWLHFTNYGVTGKAGTGNSLYLYTTDLAPYAELRGSFATDRNPKTENFSNKFGAMTCAYYFWKNLQDTGWKVTGGYADIDRAGWIRGGDFFPAEKAPAQKDLTVAGKTQSPSLSLIARETNHRSDNFYAETILRTMGEEATGWACYDSCYAAQADVLDALGVSPDGFRIEDGSGLSRHNYISPDFMVRYLEAMKRSPSFKVFLESLPYPGAPGTLQSILGSLPATTRSRIRMKSGSMDGVLCYSGYILPANGAPEDAVVFSIMTNNTVASPSEVRLLIMNLISRLCGDAGQQPARMATAAALSANHLIINQLDFKYHT